MVDPITAVATATAAFNTIKSAFAAGRDIEGMAGDLSRWMGAVSDIKKAEDMREELKNIISFTRGPSAWEELLKTEADIRKRRQQAIYDQQERRRKVFEIIMVVVASLAMLGFIAFIIYLVGVGQGKW